MSLTAPNFMPPADSVWIPQRPDIRWGGAGVGWQMNGQPLPQDMMGITLAATGKPGTMMEGATYTGANGVWNIPDKPAAQTGAPQAMTVAAPPAATVYTGPQYAAPYGGGYGGGMLGLPTGGALVLDLVSLGALAAKLYTAFVSLPPTPIKTGDVETDVNNGTLYAQAIAQYEQRGRQILVIADAVKEVFRPGAVAR